MTDHSNHHHSHRHSRHNTASQKELSIGLKAIEAGTFGVGTERLVNLASNYVGMRATGTNTGAVVSHFCGAQGLPWCGGFAHYVAEHSIPGVYNQPNFMVALSYKQEAERFGAFRKPNTMPKVGDMAVFSRVDPLHPTGGDGHVGVVTRVDPDGTVSYVSGNSNNSVAVEHYNWRRPPSNLLGHSDTQNLAEKKGVKLEMPNTRMADAIRRGQELAVMNKGSTPSMGGLY